MQSETVHAGSCPLRAFNNIHIKFVSFIHLIYRLNVGGCVSLKDSSHPVLSPHDRNIIALNLLSAL